MPDDTPFGSQSQDLYYDDVTTVTGAELLRRLKAAFEIANELESQMRKIRNTANARGLDWPTSMESILAHMGIDLQYLKAEILLLTEK